MTPTLLLMKGYPATGKSTLAQALARRLEWPLIDKDDIKDCVHDLPAGNELAYEIMWRITRRQLAQQLSVIVDSPLSYPLAYATGRELARESLSELLVVETCPPDTVWRARMDGPDRGASAHKIRDWSTMQDQLQRYGGQQHYAIDSSHHLRVDTSRPLDEIVPDIITHLLQDKDGQSRD